MNYINIYEKIIHNAQSFDRAKLSKDDSNYEYFEQHHIIPSCLGGTNDKHNLVLLTAREHYICHKLLTYIHVNNRKIGNAYHLMTFDKHGNRKISARDYEYARYLKANIPVSEETRLRMSLSGGHNHHGGWEGHYVSNVTKEKLRIASTDRKHSPETIEKIKLRTKEGMNNPEVKAKLILNASKRVPWNKGKTNCFSRDTLDRMSKAHLGQTSPRKGVTLSDETKLKIGNGKRKRK